jgi:16S rRNA (adenine1518-N6/adenine1519-N6)-dimethyltransferase
MWLKNLKKFSLNIFNLMTKITFVDDKDNVIGAGAKEDAWKKGIIHRIARIFLFNSKGELLITKRADNLSSLPGRWDQSAAGHVDEGEDYPTAAKRELEEEVGVKGIELIEKGKFFTDETDESGKIKKRFSMSYTGKWDGEVKPSPREVSQIRWIQPKELDEWMNRSPLDFTAGFIRNFKHLRSMEN